MSIDVSNPLRQRPVVVRQIDTDSWNIDGTEYRFTLDDITFDGETATVETSVERIGNTAIVDDTHWALFVDGVQVDTDRRDFGTSTMSGPASEGDPIEVVVSTEQFGGHVAEVSGAIPDTENGERGCDHPDVGCPMNSRCIDGECVPLSEIGRNNAVLGAGILLILGWAYYSGT